MNEVEQKQKCAGCEHCKIWYDKDNYTMRLSCMASGTKQGRTITWRSYPTYEKVHGIMVKTKDTIESISEEFENYASRRLSPSWCIKRKEKQNMSNLNNTSEESLKEVTEGKNYDLVTDLSQKLNLLKGYEVGYSNPKKGIFIINKEGTNYVVNVNPILKDDMSLKEAMHEFGYLFR